MMTVAELLARLQTCAPDARILVAEPNPPGRCRIFGAIAPMPMKCRLRNGEIIGENDPEFDVLDPASEFDAVEIV